MSAIFWKCEKCETMNVGERKTCWKCGTAHPKESTPLEKLFSPDDSSPTAPAPATVPTPSRHMSKDLETFLNNKNVWRQMSPQVRSWVVSGGLSDEKKFIGTYADADAKEISEALLGLYQRSQLSPTSTPLPRPASPLPRLTRSSPMNEEEGEDEELEEEEQTTPKWQFWKKKPREINDTTTAARAKSRKIDIGTQPRKVWIGVGIGVAVVLTIIGILIFGGKKEKPYDPTAADNYVPMATAQAQATAAPTTIAPLTPEWYAKNSDKTSDPITTKGVATVGEWSILLRVGIGVFFGIIVDVYQAIFGKKKKKFPWWEITLSVLAATLFVLFTYGADWKITSLINPFASTEFRYTYSLIMAVVFLIISGLATRDPSRPGSAMIIVAFLYVAPFPKPGLLGHHFGSDAYFLTLTGVLSRIGQGNGGWLYTLVVGMLFFFGCSLVMINLIQDVRKSASNQMGNHDQQKSAASNVTSVVLATALTVGLWLLPALPIGASLITQLVLVIIGMIVYRNCGENGDEAIIFGTGGSSLLGLLFKVTS